MSAKHSPNLAEAFRLDGAVCVVTGGGSGIGQATAVTLASAGAARLVVVGRTASKLEETGALIAAVNPRCTVERVAADVARPEGRAAVLDVVARQDGRLDVLVNNAGLFEASSLAATTDAAWHDHLAVNLTAPFALTRDLLPCLGRSGRGSVVNVSSTLATKPIPNAAAYNAAKAGLIQLTRSLALELAPAGIRVNAVLPAIVETPMYRGRYADQATYDEGMSGAATLHPLGRVGQPSDIALAILYLASPAAAWVTGVGLPVDGGMLCT